MKTRSLVLKILKAQLGHIIGGLQDAIKEAVVSAMVEACVAYYGTDDPEQQELVRDIVEPELSFQLDHMLSKNITMSTAEALRCVCWGGGHVHACV